MPTLIDTSLWIDFTRKRSPQALKRFIAPYILDPEAHLAEPITFEVLRHAMPAEAKQLTQQFQTLPTLATPFSLWPDAVELGQACRQKNITVNSLDASDGVRLLRRPLAPPDYQSTLAAFDTLSDTPGSHPI